MNKTVKRILGSILALKMILGISYTVNSEVKPQVVEAATSTTWKGKT